MVKVLETCDGRYGISAEKLEPYKKDMKEYIEDVDGLLAHVIETVGFLPASLIGRLMASSQLEKLKKRSSKLKKRPSKLKQC